MRARVWVPVRQVPPVGRPPGQGPVADLEAPSSGPAGVLRVVAATRVGERFRASGRWAAPPSLVPVSWTASVSSPLPEVDSSSHEPAVRSWCCPHARASLRPSGRLSIARRALSVPRARGPPPARQHLHHHPPPTIRAVAGWFQISAGMVMRTVGNRLATDWTERRLSRLRRGVGRARGVGRRAHQNIVADRACSLLSAPQYGSPLSIVCPIG